MPKYQRTGNNPGPFVKNSQNMHGGRVINLRTRGLVLISNVFEEYVQAELGEKDVAWDQQP